MATKPIETPLPADLPENWTAGQIVAPDGTTAGLTKQHGYNYLMEQVNRAQQGVNAVNQAFETVSGKRTCRVVVGTSTAGWTAADCDFLCDGVDDQVEINQAIALLKEHGGEIVILTGEYNVAQEVSIDDMGGDITIVGNPGSTVLNLSASIEFYGSFVKYSCCLWGLSFQAHTYSNMQFLNVGGIVQNCTFLNVRIGYSHSAESLFGDFLFLYNSVELDANADFSTIGGNAILSIFTWDGTQRAIVSHNSFKIAESVKTPTNILISL